MQHQIYEDHEQAYSLLSAIVASTRHLMIATDLSGTVTLFNRASELALGYSAAEIVNQSTPAIWHDEGEVVRRAAELTEELVTPIAPGFDVFVAKPLRFGTESREWTFIRKDGSTFPVQLTVTCIRDANDVLVGYLGVIEDITERKLAQQQLEDSKSFLDLINNNNPDFIFVKDEEFRIVEANPAFISLYPEDKQDRVIGYTTVEDYDEKEAAAFLEKDKEAFIKGSSETIEKVRTPDGALRILNTKKIRFQNQEAKRFILCIARDVTENEKLVEDLKQSNNELEEFAYRTSHDLRSPLVSSIALLGVAKQSVVDGNVERALTSMEHIRNSLTKLEALVKGILSLAHTKNAQEEEQEVGIYGVVSEILEKFSHMKGFERLRFIIDISETQTIMVKPSHFALIIENLISNAIKYQDPSEQEPYVRILTVVRGLSFELRVEDNGLGIPKEQQHRMFEMFRRFHSGVAFGSGLGLYMMKKSAVVLGGNLSFEDPGKGSIFTLKLPLMSSAH